MKKRHTIILLILAALFSCTKENIIPEETLEEIYYDIYMTDSYIRYQIFEGEIPDSALIYEPIFNRYGYTSEDYLASNNHYLKDPERFGKIFKRIKVRLQERENYLTVLHKYTRKLDTFIRKMDSIPIVGNPRLKANDHERALNFIFYTRYHDIVEMPAPDLIFQKAPRGKVEDSLEIIHLTEKFRKEDSILISGIHRELVIRDTLLQDSIRIACLARLFREQDSLMKISLLNDPTADFQEQKFREQDSLIRIYPNNVMLIFGYQLKASYDPGYFVQGYTVPRQIKEAYEKKREEERRYKEAIFLKEIERQKNEETRREKKTSLQPVLRLEGNS